VRESLQRIDKPRGRTGFQVVPFNGAIRIGFINSIFAAGIEYLAALGGWVGGMTGKYDGIVSGRAVLFA